MAGTRVIRGGGPQAAVSLCPSDFVTSSEERYKRDAYWVSAIKRVLSPPRQDCDRFNQQGLVVAALPHLQSPRLSAQQGLFLFNAASALTFQQSLNKMMGQTTAVWYRRFRIPADPETLHELERRLFEFNIHELALFPDTEGLARFTVQKVRLFS